MKRSEVNEKKQKFQEVKELAKMNVLHLLASHKDSIYTMREIIDIIVTKQYEQYCAEMGLSTEEVRYAIISAVCELKEKKKVIRDSIGSENYFGSK